MNYLRVDINILTEDARQEYLKLALNEVYASTLRAVSEITSYTALSFGMFAITNETFNNTKNNKLEGKYNEVIRKMFTQFSDLFYTEGDNFLNGSIEKCYINYYQAFEVFVGNIFKVIFWHFPIFLGQKQSIDTQELFMSENILVVRNKLIEDRVKELIQTNNIKQVIIKLKDIFGIKLNNLKDDLDKLVIASHTRNLLIHNEGIVNNVFLKGLVNNKIKLDYQAGDKILISEKMLRDYNEYYNKMIKLLFENVENQIEGITRYAASKTS